MSLRDGSRTKFSSSTAVLEYYELVSVESDTAVVGVLGENMTITLGLLVLFVLEYF
jgi:hypothetical protein